MDREDWTPAVLITASICLLTAGLVWLVTPWDPLSDRDAAGQSAPRRHGPAQITVWTGELAPGLKGVLGPVWGDPKPDKDHDSLLNDDLGLDGAEALAYFRLLVFNTTDEDHTLVLRDGELRMVDEGGGGPILLRSLAAMEQQGEIEISGGLAFSLRSLGALQERIEIPAGRFAKLVVPFARGARLETAKAVATMHGTALVRRRIAAAEFRQLLSDPDETRLEDL
jgi:hypothetical protein